MDMIEIGLAIREARKSAGISQAELAKSLGMTQATISILESGQVEEIGIRKVMRVMDRVGLTLTAKPLQHGYTLEDAQHDLQSSNNFTT